MSGKKRYTRSQLCSVVQASDQELDEGLRENNVVEIDGEYRYATIPQFARILSHACCVSSPGHLVYLPLNHLLPLLSILLSLVTLHTISTLDGVELSSQESLDRQFFPLVDPVPIRETLKQDHRVQEEIFDGLQGLFGRKVKPEGSESIEAWVVDVKRVIREMGKGMLLEENVSESPK